MAGRRVHGRVSGPGRPAGARSSETCQRPRSAIPLAWATPDGRSIPFVDLDPSEGTLGLLVDDLAEAFGVTAAFMAVRLAKGGFIGRRFESGSTI